MPIAIGVRCIGICVIDRELFVIRETVGIIIGIVGLEGCLHRLIRIHLQIQLAGSARGITEPTFENITIISDRRKSHDGAKWGISFVIIVPIVTRTIPIIQTRGFNVATAIAKVTQ